MLSKFAPWLKFVQPTIILLLIGVCAFLSGQVSTARGERDDLKVDRAEIARALEVAPRQTVMLSKITADKLTSINRKATLDRISIEALEARNRTLVADSKLDDTQKTNAGDYAKAKPVIDTLAGRKSTGDTSKDRLVIAQDSKAAWQGWSK